MLEEQEQMQRNGYPAAKIWIIQEDCDPIPKADLVIANLVAEYIGIARLD